GTCDADCDVDVPVTDPSVTYNKSADTAGPVSVGDVITYTLTATVTNSQLVTDLVLTDTLGVGLTFGSVTNAGAFTCTGSLSCTLPAGTVPGTYTVTYTATVNDQATGTVSNAVVAQGGNDDPSGPPPSCAGECEVVVEVEQDVTTVRIVKQASPREVRVGDLVRYTVVMENTGSYDLVNGTLVDMPPAGFTYVDSSLTVADRDGAGVVVGRYPVIRV